MDALEIISKNYQADREKLASLCLRFPSYADELARLLLGQDASEATDEELELSYRELKEALDTDGEAQGAFPLALKRAEGALLAAEIASSLVKNAAIHTFLPTPDSVDGKCVYFRNAYSDEAYRVFAPYLTVPTASYSDSPMAACRDVYNELAAFAILPICSSKEGVLTGMARVIARFELAPVMFCDITLPGSDETMTMGLYAAYPMSVEPPEGLEAILFADDCATLSSLTLSLTFLDIELQSIEALDETQGFRYAYRIVLHLPHSSDFLPLWLLLRCEYPRHQLCGIWRTISKK